MSDQRLEKATIANDPNVVRRDRIDTLEESVRAERIRHF